MDSPKDGTNSAGSSIRVDSSLEELASALFEGKRERRRHLAALPFDAKIRIVVELQRLAYETRCAAGLLPREPWRLP